MMMMMVMMMMNLYLLLSSDERRAVTVKINTQGKRKKEKQIGQRIELTH